jgi:hypothetical protein
VTKNNLIARIENRFVFHAQYQLSAREQKVILFLIANMDPKKQSRFHEQVIPVKELEYILKNDDEAKWGGLYQEMREFTKRIRNKGIEFDTDIEIDGKKFPGYVNWFQSVEPIKLDSGEVAISFLFSEKLKPFLIDLNEYARINYLEAAPLKSSYAIRMFQIFKAARGRMQKHEEVSTMEYEVEQLKSVLGIPGKYEDFRNFRRRVLDVILEEINEHTNIILQPIRFKRGGRVITKVVFKFGDKQPVPSGLPKGRQPEAEPTPADLGKLTKSQLLAFEKLKDFGVKAGIALWQILPRITGSEFSGFEDLYFEEAIGFFSSKTKQKTQPGMAGAFVKWFLELKVFEQGDQFSVIVERMQARKKKLQTEKGGTAWDNRLVARSMTAKEFDAWVKGN